MPADDSAPADGFTFERDGTVTVHLDDGDRTIRRPKVGELRRLREAHTGLQRAKRHERQAMNERVADVQRRIEALPPTDADTPGRRSELLHEAEAEGEGFIDFVYGQNIGWARLAFDGGQHHGEHVAGLADKPLPDNDDDLPAWFLDAGLPAALLNHWTTAPPPRGAR